MFKQREKNNSSFRRLRHLVGAGFFVLLLTTVSLSMVLRPAVEAATANSLNFQARLMQANGALVPDGFYNVQFKLYNVSSAGSALWTETYYDSNGATAGNDNRVRVVNGYVTVNLNTLNNNWGSITSWDQELWLTMNIGGVTQTATPTWDGEMNPRLKLTAVPYAFQAKNAEGLNKTTGVNTSTLSWANQTAANAILLPDAAGTVCLQGNAACGFVTGAAADYIQNSTSLQAANFHISGIGQADTALVTPTLRPTADSTTALQVQNAAGSSVLLNMDTTNGRVGIGLTNPSQALTLSSTGKLGFDNGSGTADVLLSRGATNRLDLTLPAPGAATLRIHGSQSGAGSVNAQIVLENGGAAGGGSLTIATKRADPSIISADFNSNNNTVSLKIDTAANNHLAIQSNNTTSNVGIGTGTTAARLHIATGAAGNIGAVVQGAVSQTGDLIQFRNSSGNVMSRINSSGGLVITPGGGLATATLVGSLLKLGYGGASSGSIELFNVANGLSVTLETVAMSASRVITLPDAAGTVCLQGNAACGFMTGSAGDYIQNGTASQTANFNITGTGSVGNLRTQDVDANGVPLNLGTTGATAVNIGKYGLMTHVQGGLSVAETATIERGIEIGSTLDPLAFTTPLGANVTSRLVIPVHNPGQFNQIIALGLSSTAATSSRVISLFDARGAGDNQPPLSVFSPDETSVFGLGWDGQNNEGYLKTIGAKGIGIKVNNNVAMSIGGTNGNVTFKNQNNTTSGFAVQNAAGDSVLRVDTLNGGAVLSGGLEVQSGAATALLVQNSSAVDLFRVNASTNQVIIGTAGTVPTLFVLGNKTNEGDPTGVEGAMYYNSAMKAFRCYRDGRWNDCGVRNIEREVVLEDEFFGGEDWWFDNDAANNVGTLAWHAAGNNNNSTEWINYNTKAHYPDSSHPGVLSLGVEANSSSSGVVLSLDDWDTDGGMGLAAGQVFKTSVALEMSTGMETRIGINNKQPVAHTTAPTAGVWWRANPAAETDGDGVAEWMYCYANGSGVETCASANGQLLRASNQANPSRFERLEIRIISVGTGTSTIEYYINGNKFTVSNVTLNQITDTSLNYPTINFSYYRTNASSSELGIDYMQFRQTMSAAR